MPSDESRFHRNCFWIPQRKRWRVFENEGWNVYFDRLRGLNEEIAAEFALNLGEEISRVREIEVPVTEEASPEVSGLPQNGQRWFSRRTSLLEFPEALLQVGESIAQKGQGYDRHSLPHPWGGVAEFVIKYGTCKGRYSTIFKYHLRILARL